MRNANEAIFEPDKKYLERINYFRLKPIRSEEENDLAAEICDDLLNNFDSLSPDEHDYLEVLSKLVEDFESQWQEEKSVQPRELLKFLMAQNNLSQTDLILNLDLRPAHQNISQARAQTCRYPKSSSWLRDSSCRQLRSLSRLVKRRALLTQRTAGA